VRYGAIVLVLFAGSVFAQKTVTEGIPALAVDISAGISRQHKPRVAVMPFSELQGPRTSLGVYIAESLTTQLVNADVDVVERRMLERVLDKLRVDATGAIDAETAKAVGREAGVEAIITGTIADLQSAIAVNARVIDAATGRIITAAEVLITRDEMVETMLAELLRPSSASPVASVAGGAANPRNLTWADGPARITIENSERKRNAIELTLLFQNPGAKPLQVSARRYALTDEHGDEYGFGYDRGNLVGKSVAVPPGKHVRGEFVFVCRTGDCNGTTFTMKDDSGAVVVHNLNIEE
jgi:TolB-like protein